MGAFGGRVHGFCFLYFLLPCIEIRLVYPVLGQYAFNDDYAVDRLFRKTAYGAVGLDTEHFGIVGTHHEYFSSAVGAYMGTYTFKHNLMTGKGVGRNQHPVHGHRV